MTDSTTATSPLSEDLSQTTISVSGMTCAACVGRVARQLDKLEGVAEASVNLTTEKATITFDSKAVSAKDIAAKIEDTGYGVRSQSIEYSVQGMTCAACSGRVERALNKSAGVLNATVNLATERANISFIPDDISPAGLKTIIEKTGYDVLEFGDTIDPTEAENLAKEAEYQKMRKALMIAAGATIPLLVFEMLPMLIPSLGDFKMATFTTFQSHFIAFILATIVQFGPGRRFFKTGWAAIKHKSPDMNVLVMMGTSAAYGFSLITTFLPWLLPAGTAFVYFEASASIITLILVGKYLEARAKGRTNDAIKKLLALQPPTATIMRAGEPVVVPIETVVVGDVVRIKPGEKVPLDGLVRDGKSWIDESMLTGESIAIEKSDGDNVIGGTLNKSGSLTVQVTAIGRDSVLAQIAKVVEQAQASRPAVQALADKVVEYFVPTVLIIAMLTFGIWMIWGPSPALPFALTNAVAVLIIACPCAMGLATPTSIMVGTARAASLGMLFRQGAALESLQDTTLIAFDKTGTLTVGNPSITDQFVLPEIDPTQLLNWTAAIESYSEHPLGEAITAAADLKDYKYFSVTGFENHIGSGITATVEGHNLAIGNQRLFDSLNLSIKTLTDQASKFSEQGKTPVFISVNGRPAGVYAIADPLKPEAIETVKALHEAGIKVAMISGDRKETTEAIAKQIGIDSVLAEVRPEEKAAAVLSFQSQNENVTFVGDGINDAPALATANTGIAIGTGTDIAIASADIILMAGDLKVLPNAIALSRATMTNIKQNLFWAFFYNVILIPVAGGILYPFFGILLSPILAAGAMSMSSIFVLTNALRLKNINFN